MSGSSKEYNEQWKKDNPDYQKNYMREWRKDNPNYYRGNPILNIKQNLKKRHNLSYEDWLGMFRSQDGKCAICKSEFDTPFNTCVDHNHKTGKIRGLLCRQCNVGLGNFKDNPKLTAKATEYLLGDK